MSVNRTSLGMMALTLAVLGASCDEPATDPEPDDEPQRDWQSCQGTDQAFVRRAVVGVLGRQPRSQGEVAALRSTFRAVSTEQGPDEAKRALVRMLAESPQYVERWSDVTMDALRIPRNSLSKGQYGATAELGCYTAEAATDAGIRPDGGQLAEFVRDSSPSATSGPMPSFRMAELLPSSIRLDDMTPLFRANLFHMLNFALGGANVTPEELEITRRLDLGRSFFETYLNRNVTCLPCHNSEASVTFSPDPAGNKAWWIPGSFEKALFGASSAEQYSLLEYSSAFRVDGVFGEGGELPWGWNFDCGSFRIPDDDPLGVEAHFGQIQSSRRATVWLLEANLRRGFDRLRGKVMTPAADGAVDPDEAFAYLTVVSFVERVWAELLGTDLTIATKFPRTEIQRDTLKALADGFTSSGYSLRDLVSTIVVHPVFNLASPDDDCWEAPYEIPRLLDPWTDGEEDEAARLNGPADAIRFRNPRTQLRILTTALEWPNFAPFPRDDEEDFQVMIGVSNSPSEPGFRGADFQAALAWEDAFAACDSPSSTDDYIDRMLASGGTAKDAIQTLWSRLVGAPSLDGDAAAALASTAGLDLSAPVGPDSEAQVRAVCGTIVSSPQFLLSGVPMDDEPVSAALERPEHGEAHMCDELRAAAPRAGVDPAFICAAPAGP